MNDTANFVAVDLGASGGRVLVGQWDGAQCRLKKLHRFANGPVLVDGHIYWDVLRLWSEIQVGLIRYAAEFDARATSVGVDTWGVDYGLLDAADRLIGNPYHYRDRRTDGMIERAFALVPAARIFEETGVQVSQNCTLYQLLSMSHHRDPQLEMARSFLMFPDLLHYWLSGRKVCEYSVASTSQMFDSRTRSWSTALLGDLGLPTHILPPLVAPGTVLGELKPEVAAHVGWDPGALVVTPGSHDTASAVAAVPDLDDTSVFVSSGTWSLIGVELQAPIVNERVQALNFGNEQGVGGTIRLLKNVTGMWLLQQCQCQWQREGLDVDWPRLMHLAEEARPFRSLIDPDSPAFWNPPDMPAAVRGYCHETGQPVPETIGEIVRCSLESLAFKYRQVVRSLEHLTGRRLSVIRIVGGGSQNHVLCQMTADACGRTVVAGPVEATALGNVILQAIATGHMPDVAAGRRSLALSVERQYYEPRPGIDRDAEFERFCAIVEMTPGSERDLTT